MKSNRPDRNDFSEALDALRQETPDPAAAEAAAGRIRRQLQEAAGAAPVPDHEPIRGCAAFQSLMPEYHAGTLSPARRALLDDHAHECVACRKALWKATSPAAPAVRLSGRRVPWAWAAAAALVLVLAAAYQIGWLDRFFLSGAEARAVAEQVDGRLFTVRDGAVAPLAAGAEIAAGQTVRAARGTHALLRMPDGTRIEMNQLSELRLEPRRDGASVGLRRGDIIVRAAKQPAGRHLYVDTADCRVTVVGTVFAVSNGPKGSRVSVLEGRVKVESDGRAETLQPGEQASTHPSIGLRPIGEEVAWSPNSAEYKALMDGVKEAGREMFRQLAALPLRHESKLLPLVPEGTAVYAAVPNVSGAVADAGAKIRDLIRQNPELQAAWEGKSGHGPAQADVDETLARFRELGGLLGDELVVAVRDVHGERPSVLILAETSDPERLKAALADGLSRLKAGDKETAPVCLVEDPTRIPDAAGFFIYVDDGVMAAATDAGSLRRFAAGKSAFAETPFHAEIARAYREGVSWLVAADLAALRDPGMTARDAEGREIASAGVEQLRYVVLEHKTVGQQPQLRASLDFAGKRQGVPAWLGSPAPMGSLEFVSPDAAAAACVLVEEPEAILDEILQAASGSGGDALAGLLQFQQEHNVNVRDDLAAPLGGEFLVALDGPVLPTPAWKAVLLVDDPARLQQTIETLVADFSRRLQDEGKPGLALAAEPLEGVPAWSLAMAGAEPSLHYVFWEGYLVMAPSRAQLSDAIRNRASGYTLPRSEAFQSALPVDGHGQFSAILYQNWETLAGTVEGFVPDAKNPDQAGELAEVRELLKNARPMMLSAWAGADRIELAWAGPQGMNLMDLAAFGNLGRVLKAHRGGLVGEPEGRRPGRH